MAMFYLCTGPSCTPIDSSPDGEEMLLKAENLAKDLRKAIQEGVGGPSSQFPIQVVRSEIIRTIEEKDDVEV